MFIEDKEKQNENIVESGFVLVLAMVVLLMISLSGVWVLQTSTSEVNVAGGTQQTEAQFSITEGSAYAEGGKVGFMLSDHYKITDPNNRNHLLIPATDALFDPGSDTDAVLANVDAADVDTWPWDNMLEDYNLPSTNNEYDYRYLTTYLYPDSPPPGYDVSLFSSYKFRIQTAAAMRATFVELGGLKIGPK